MDGLIWLAIILNIVIIFKLIGLRRRVDEMQDSLKKTRISVECLASRALKIVHVQKETPLEEPESVPVPAPVPQPVVSMTVPADVPPVAPPPLPAVDEIEEPSQPWIVPPAREAPVRSELPDGESTNTILDKIWNWFLWNQETRPENMSLEYAFASVWLLRIGILGVVMFVAFFLRWSIQQNLLGPGARVGITVLTGVGMLILGMRLLGKKYHLIGQGLLGGGVLSLYFSVYASGPGMYKLLSFEPVFGLMVLVTIVAVFLAVRVDSLLIAVLGLAGGYLTPFLIHTPAPSLPGFYSYVLLLTTGILVVAARKQWRLLQYLSFIFTYALFIESLTAYHGRPDFPMVMTFLTAFFVLHTVMPAIYNILRRTSSTVLEIIYIVVNAGLYAGLGYHLVSDAWGRPYPALLSLGLALFFTTHVVVFIGKKLQDRKLLVCLLALAGAFTTWTLPLALEKETLTISLALLAFVFLWIGRKIGSAFLQNFGQALYLVVFVRLLVLDLPRNYWPLPDTQVTGAQYWQGLLDRLWTFGLSIGSVAAAFFVQRRDVSVGGGKSVVPTAAAPNFGLSTWTTALFFWFGIFFAFLFAHLELWHMFMFWPSLRPPVLTALWCGMAGYFLWKYLFQERNAFFCAALCVFVFGAVFKIFVFDLSQWNMNADYIYQADYTAVFVFVRLLDFALPLLLLVAGFRLFAAQADCRAIAAWFGYGALALLFTYLTLELNSLLFWKLPEFRAGGISVLWVLFAISFIVGGIWRNVRTLRYTGLVLCMIVVVKVLMDTAHMQMLYRFIAYLVMGVLLLLGSFAYIFSSRKFTTQDPEKRP